MEKTAKKVTKTPESKPIKPHPVFKSFERFGISFSNHLLCSPFMEHQADRKGRVTPALIRHYVSMIQQGVGAVIVERAYVSQQGRNNLHQLGISEEEHLEGLAQLVKAVKKKSPPSVAMKHRLSEAVEKKKTSPPARGSYMLVTLALGQSRPGSTPISNWVESRFN